MAALLIALAMVREQARFVVDETQFAIVTRFGVIIRSVTEPGHYSKRPFTDTVIYLTKELDFYVEPECLRVKGGEWLMIDLIGRGRIIHPLDFLMEAGSEDAVARHVFDVVREWLRAEPGLDDQQVKDAIAPQLARFGIELEVVDVETYRDDSALRCKLDPAS